MFTEFPEKLIQFFRIITRIKVTSSIKSERAKKERDERQCESVLDVAWWTGSAVRHLPTSVLCGIMPSGAMRKSEARPLDFGSCESNRTGESAVSCVKLLSREIALVRFVFESRGESSIRWPNFDEFIRTWMPESRRQLLLDRGNFKNPISQQLFPRIDRKRISYWIWFGY